jgi:hypothetical protein
MVLSTNSFRAVQSYKNTELKKKGHWQYVVGVQPGRSSCVVFLDWSGSMANDRIVAAANSLWHFTHTYQTVKLICFGEKLTRTVRTLCAGVKLDTLVEWLKKTPRLGTDLDLVTTMLNGFKTVGDIHGLSNKELTRLEVALNLTEEEKGVLNDLVVGKNSSDSDKVKRLQKSLADMEKIIETTPELADSLSEPISRTREEISELNGSGHTNTKVDALSPLSFWFESRIEKNTEMGNVSYVERSLYSKLDIPTASYESWRNDLPAYAGTIYEAQESTADFRTSPTDDIFVITDCLMKTKIKLIHDIHVNLAVMWNRPYPEKFANACDVWHVNNYIKYIGNNEFHYLKDKKKMVGTYFGIAYQHFLANISVREAPDMSFRLEHAEGIVQVARSGIEEEYVCTNNQWKLRVPVTSEPVLFILNTDRPLKELRVHLDRQDASFRVQIQKHESNEFWNAVLASRNIQSYVRYKCAPFEGDKDLEIPVQLASPVQFDVLMGIVNEYHSGIMNKSDFVSTMLVSMAFEYITTTSRLDMIVMYSGMGEREMGLLETTCSREGRVNPLLKKKRKRNVPDDVLENNNENTAKHSRIVEKKKYRRRRRARW